LILSSSSRRQRGRVVLGLPRALRARGTDLGRGPAHRSTNVFVHASRRAPPYRLAETRNEGSLGQTEENDYINDIKN
jgi:hypothetical protein